LTAPAEAAAQESVPAAHQEPELNNHAVERTVVPVAAEESPEPVAVAAVRASERSDRAEYERILAYFKEGNLDGSRDGFSAFLAEYPNSDLAPNARYWLGESHYGKKDYKQAIDSYDRVEIDYPQSEKVPAAILKKGFAYLALKDKKRASSAFKQVVTLYPKSPEAGKAYDKLNQLKEVR
jgi:tol-pal system protein YbgF